MFGYIRPYQSDLKVREFEEYKAVYCALCRHLGEQYGFLARMTLSYDCTFWLLVAIGLREEEQACVFCRRRCAVNPMKKCGHMQGQEELFRFAAALSVLLTAEKLQDDRLDGAHRWARIRSRILLFLTRRARKKAALDEPELAEVAHEMTVAQRAAEEGEKARPDECADPTARLLQYVFGRAARDDQQKRVLEEFGYFLGRWVYFMDAGDDLTKDLNKGEFNVFLQKFSVSSPLEKEKQQEIETAINELQNMNAARIQAALSLLPVQVFSPIVQNIVCLGLAFTQRSVLFTHTYQKGKKLDYE